jgi:transcriptional regulator with XRE-family HTH domain
MTKTEPREWTPAMLRALRESKNWTQAQAAAEVHVTNGTWSLWERGLVKPPRSKHALLNFLFPNVALDRAS